MYHRQGYGPAPLFQLLDLPDPQHYGPTTPEEITTFLDAVESLSLQFEIGSSLYWEIFQCLFIGFDRLVISSRIDDDHVVRLAKWKGWKGIKRVCWKNPGPNFYQFLSQPEMYGNLSQLTHLSILNSDESCELDALSLIGKSCPNLISLMWNLNWVRIGSSLKAIKSLLGIGFGAILPNPSTLLPNIFGKHSTSTTLFTTTTNKSPFIFKNENGETIPTPTNLPNLTTLDLSSSLCHESLSLLMSAEFLPKLTAFRCSAAPGTVPTVITTSPKAHQLTLLDLSASFIPPDQLIKLATCPSLVNLTHLNLTRTLNQFPPGQELCGDDVALAFLQSPHLTNLIDLNLGKFGNLRPTNSAQFHLALEDIFNTKPQLKLLQVSGSGMDPDAILRGAQCPDDFETIRLPDLYFGKDPNTLVQFIQSGKLTNLKVLDLGNNQIGDDIVNLLFRNRYMPGLESDDDEDGEDDEDGQDDDDHNDDGKMSDDTNSHPTLPNLTTLILEDNAITAKGCEYISKANPKWFPYFSELVLGYNPDMILGMMGFLPYPNPHALPISANSI